MATRRQATIRREVFRIFDTTCVERVLGLGVIATLFALQLLSMIPYYQVLFSDPWGPMPQHSLRESLGLIVAAQLHFFVGTLGLFLAQSLFKPPHRLIEDGTGKFLVLILLIFPAVIIGIVVLFVVGGVLPEFYREFLTKVALLMVQFYPILFVLTAAVVPAIIREH